MLHDALVQVAGDTDVKCACIGAENVDVATRHSRMLASLGSRPQGETVGISPMWASVVEKGRSGMGKISSAGVLRLRATKHYVTR
jgi:hypothetical protein